MRDLLSAELSRLAHRRFAHVMVGLLVGIMVLVALSFVATSEPPSQFEREYAAREAAQAQVQYDRERSTCLDVARGVTSSYGRRYPANCDYGPRPTTEDFLHFEFVLTREFEALMILAGISLCLFAFLVAASFIGAEWTSGGLTNLLLWRPRRGAVLGSKLAVVLGGILAASVVYIAAWIGTFMLVGMSQGAVGTATAGELTSFALLVVRVLLLALVMGALGFALASLGRHTAMALGTLIGYLVVYEVGVTIVSQIVGEDWPMRFRLTTYVAAWLLTELRVDQGYDCGPRGCGVVALEVVTWREAGMVLGALAVGLVVAAFWSLRRRDIA